ncbi:MAG TPA: RNA methyltransferase [Peptococcaceae bacterium]|nr:RNA methyltransferase [Peptococcaceae bacterium]
MITSLQNDQVKHLAALQTNKGRKEYKEYLIEGKRFVQEALLRKAEICKLYFCPTFLKPSASEQDRDGTALNISNLVGQARELTIPVEEVSETVLRKISATEEPQGIVAIVKQPSSTWEDIKVTSKTILLIVDNIQDPGNLGTILRTALAADVRQIILTKGTVDLYNPKVLRSTMGAVFSQVILKDKNPQEIVDFVKRKNCTLAVSTMEGISVFKEDASSYHPIALVIGNEAIGPSAYFLEKADKKLSIPMFNKVESLNAAMAAGIFLYELRRQARFL